MNEKNIELIRSVLQKQIGGYIDAERAKGYWRNLLNSISDEEIAEAVSSELTHFKYEEKKSCSICCHRR
jgi:hypothetical protein